MKVKDKDQLNKILNGYLEAAIWTEEERLDDELNGFSEDGDEFDIFMGIKNNFNEKPFDEFIIDNIDIDSKIQAYIDIRDFIEKAGKEAIEEILKVNDEFKLGMDIWLTRNYHGADFFDHGYTYEKELMDAAYELGPVNLYTGDDNKLYFSNSN